jgi:Cu+-exporting ATPase
MANLPATTEVVDPVCGMTISPADAVGTAEYKGHTYHFCSDSCLEQFRSDPAKFVDSARQPASTEPVDPEAEYTCPMHPEIRQKGPGSCPICGMALEPVTVTLDEQRNEELEDMTRRFRWSLWLTAPILAFMVDELTPGQPLHRLLPRGALNWIELALATPSSRGLDGRSFSVGGRRSSRDT